MIKELHERLKLKQTTAVELAKEYLNIIKEKNDVLNTYLGVYEEEAIKEAATVDEKIQAGKRINYLEGIPCALKDNMCMRGRRTSAASKMLDNYVAPYDATVVQKLKRKGVVFLGKTNLDEYAMGASTENSAFGETKNPFDKTRVAGGSSGGSVAAVAADLAAWALGSDTGGSVRQPAGFCGIVGLRPTYGRVSRYGLIAMASSYDQIGPIAKSVEDVAMVFDAIHGKDSKDNTTGSREKENFNRNLKPEIKGKKIGIVDEFFDNEGLDKDVHDKIEERIKWAQENGAKLVKVELPNFKYSLAVYYLMITSEISSNLARLDGMRFGFNEVLQGKGKSKDIIDVYKYSRQEGFGDEPKRRIALGTYALSAGYYDAYYKKAQQVREEVKKELAEAFKKVDVIVSPTSPTPAFKIGEKADDPLQMYLADYYTVSSPAAMIPAISIPAGKVRRDSKNLPVGLQLMGKWWGEQELLNMAAALELK